MNITRDDLKRLRVPIAVAIVLLALGAACLIAGGYHLDEATMARDATRLSRVAAQERVLRVAEEEREIRDDLVYYEQMRQRGIVGEQSRLDWIESISRIKMTGSSSRSGTTSRLKNRSTTRARSAGAADFVVSR